MKKNKKYIICVLLVFFFSLPTLYCQEIMEISGDTLITLTPTQLGTLNSILSEHGSLKREIAILDSLTAQQDTLVSVLEQKIETQDQIVAAKTGIIREQDAELQRLGQKMKTQRKKGWFWSGVCMITTFFIGLLVN